MTSLVLASIFSMFLAPQDLESGWVTSTYEPPADSASVAWEVIGPDSKGVEVTWVANGIVQEIWQGGLVYVVNIWPHSIDLMVERRRRELIEEKLQDLRSLGWRCKCR